MERELYEKLFQNVVREEVFELLGTLRKRMFERLSKNLSEEEKKQLAEALLEMTESSCRAFITEMRDRIKKKN